LVLTGRDDMVLDRRNSEILRETLPTPIWFKTKSGGHAMMYQFPKLLAHEIDRSMVISAIDRAERKSV
jgi:hypothetical protein